MVSMGSLFVILVGLAFAEEGPPRIPMLRAPFLRSPSASLPDRVARQPYDRQDMFQAVNEGSTVDEGSSESQDADATPSQEEATKSDDTAQEEKKEETPATPERYFVMESLQGTWLGAALDEWKVQLSGWTEISFTGSTAEDSNLPLGFDYRANQFNLQQNWLRIERPVDTSSKTDPSWGFLSDTILPGTDYFFTLARGLFNGQLTANDGRPNLYGIDPVQFYLEGYFPTIGQGMTVQFGHFFARYGVESIAAVNNSLVSHAYTFIYDPFTNTGLVTSTKLDDEWSVQAGIVTGSDMFIAPGDNPTFVGGVTWQRTGGEESFVFYTIVGRAQFNQAQNFHNPDIFDIVYTRKLTPKLTYNFEGLYGFTNNVPGTGFANWFGLVNYLTYEFTSQLSGTTRLEFFDDEQGQRTGFPGLYIAPTVGLNYRPHKSIVIRPEVRYDNNVETRPFEDEHDLFTAVIDVIFRW
jgi:hypothetical protein